MVFQVVESVGVAKKKIGERKASPGNAGQGSETGLAGNAGVKGAAGDVGLRVIVAANFHLVAEMKLVVAAQHGNARRQIILSVAVLNKTLPLRAHDAVRKVRDAGSGR